MRRHIEEYAGEAAAAAFLEKRLNMMYQHHVRARGPLDALLLQTLLTFLPPVVVDVLKNHAGAGASSIPRA